MKNKLKRSQYKEISATHFVGRMKVPTSKSVANRLLILASIFPKTWTLKDMPTSTDVETLIQCLSSIGLNIKRDADSIKIANTFPSCEKKTNEVIELVTGDGGTTNRFLAALLARGHNKYKLIPSEKMIERPMQELINALNTLGVNASRDESGSLFIQGPMNKVTSVQVDCSRSTQFATAMALATSDMKITILPVKMENSEKYFTMTKTLIDRAKKGITDYYINPDGSGVGYPLAMACFGGKVTLENVHEVDPEQADFAIIELLKKMNANIEWTKDGLTLTGDRELKSFDANASIYPDLMLTLAFLASYATGISNFSQLEILKHKESDRLEEMLSMLKQFKVKHSYQAQEDKLTIYGPASKQGKMTITPAIDHRVVMVSYLFLRKNSGGILHHCHAVKKSFPDFFKIMGD